MRIGRKTISLQRLLGYENYDDLVWLNFFENKKKKNDKYQTFL